MTPTADAPNSARHKQPVPHHRIPTFPFTAPLHPYADESIKQLPATNPDTGHARTVSDSQSPTTPAGKQRKSRILSPFASLRRSASSRSSIAGNTPTDSAYAPSDGAYTVTPPATPPLETSPELDAEVGEKPPKSVGSGKGGLSRKQSFTDKLAKTLRLGKSKGKSPPLPSGLVGAAYPNSEPPTPTDAQSPAGIAARVPPQLGTVSAEETIGGFNFKHVASLPLRSDSEQGSSEASGSKFGRAVASAKQRLAPKWKDESASGKKNARKWWMTSSTAKEEVPQTWDGYNEAYARGEIDIQNPPPPPGFPADQTLDEYSASLPPVPDNAADGFQSQFYVPPRPPNERQRQAVLNRLDVFGRLGRSPNTKSPEKIEADSQEEAQREESDSLESNEAFRNIVTQARALFDTSVAMLTVLDDEKQIFLAESGLGGMREVPRDVAFCNHTVLNGGQGFVLLDTHKDWRFKQNPLTVNYGSRFYAGIPIFAPSTSDDPAEESYPLGTLCVVHDQPRAEFGEDQKDLLRQLAEFAQREIEIWVRARMDVKLSRMERKFIDFKQKRAAIVAKHSKAIKDSKKKRKVKVKRHELTPVVEVDTPLVEQGIFSGPLADMDGQARFGDGNAIKKAAEQVAKPAGVDIAQPQDPRATPILLPTGGAQNDSSLLPGVELATSRSPVTGVDEQRVLEADTDAEEEEWMSASNSLANTPDSFAALRPSKNRKGSNESVMSSASTNLANVFSLATRMVGETLELSLVYLLAMDFKPLADRDPNEATLISLDGEPVQAPLNAEEVERVRLLSSWNMPTPQPAFDTMLHLKALRAKERGILYQNPAFEELEDGEKFPAVDKVAEAVEGAEGTEGDGDDQGRDYSSAILVPVCEVGPAEGEQAGRGYVLCAFTDDPKRVFGLEDLVYIQSFAENLEEFVVQEGLV